MPTTITCIAKHQPRIVTFDFTLLAHLALYTMPVVHHDPLPELWSKHVQACRMPTPSTGGAADHSFLNTLLVNSVCASAEATEVLSDDCPLAM